MSVGQVDYAGVSLDPFDVWFAYTLLIASETEAMTLSTGLGAAMMLMAAL